MRTDTLMTILQDLDASSADIQAAAVISADGLMMASMLPQGLDEDRVGAMGAALLSLGTRVARELDRGTPEQVLVKGELGYVLMVQAGPDAVLTVLASSSAKLGLVFLDARRAALALAQAL
jgi:predicted regulator of Ras-like GTPase activity (Roadblock/LC7/MglB family)